MLNTKIGRRVLSVGLWGHPNNLAAFGRQFEAACDTQSIEMPWSRRRNDDQLYPLETAEIATQVKSLL